jgi:hypothetical protein
MSDVELQILFITAQQIVTWLLVCKVADYRWRERKREGWTEEFVERAAKGEDVWANHSTEDKKCCSEPEQSMYIHNGESYRAQICPTALPKVRIEKSPDLDPDSGLYVDTEADDSEFIDEPRSHHRQRTISQFCEPVEQRKSR